jgi:hypothetical protein
MQPDNQNINLLIKRIEAILKKKLILQQYIKDLADLKLLKGPGESFNTLPNIPGTNIKYTAKQRRIIIRDIKKILNKL